jgi:hypothetical protein
MFEGLTQAAEPGQKAVGTVGKLEYTNGPFSYIATKLTT